MKHTEPGPSVDDGLPEGVHIARGLPAGRYPLVEVFQGLDKAPAFRKYPGSDRDRRNLARKTSVELARRRGEWMYVAPHEIPPNAPKQWRPITSPTDCVVVGYYHLRKSPAVVLYLDILHELYHVVQRREGRELWDETFDYVDRPTEVEAYRFCVEEGRRLGLTDKFLREYLKVVWVPPKAHRRLLKNVGVALR